MLGTISYRPKLWAEMTIIRNKTSHWWGPILKITNTNRKTGREGSEKQQKLIFKERIIKWHIQCICYCIGIQYHTRVQSSFLNAVKGILKLLSHRWVNSRAPSFLFFQATDHSNSFCRGNGGWTCEYIFWYWTNKVIWKIHAYSKQRNDYSSKCSTQTAHTWTETTYTSTHTPHRNPYSSIWRTKKQTCMNIVL